MVELRLSSETVLEIEDEVDNKLSWQKDEYKQLVVELLSETRWQNEDKEKLSLGITLSLLRGRSLATVLQLVFNDNYYKYSLIIRCHSSKQAAETEQNHVQKLRINSADHFANFITELKISNQYLLIYEDVSVNTCGEKAQELREYLVESLSEDYKIIDEQFITLANNFQAVIKRVTKSYEEIEKGTKGKNCTQYCNDILLELPPDLVINNGYLYQADNLIVRSSKATPHEKKPVEPISKAQILQRLSDKKWSVQWFELDKIWCEDKDYILEGESKIAYLALFVKINTKKVRIWMGIDKDEIRNIKSKLDRYQSYQLIFLAEAVTFTTQLEKMGFESQSCLSITELQELNAKYNIEAKLDMRHNDLHCGNVLLSDNSFKVIDVGDMKVDLIASDMARLEVSLWFEMSRRLSKFSKAEAKAVLKNLLTEQPFDTQSFSISSLFGEFLSHLRKGFAAGVENLPETKEIVLAYVIQILLYQRYSLLDGIKIPAAFNVFAYHWISQFKTEAPSQPSIPSQPLSKEEVTQPSGENNLMQIVLIYKRHAQPDEQVLNLLEKLLRQAGHQVFIDRHLRFSEEWEQQITSEIQKADAVVILLSATAIYSEMFAHEVDIAYQTSLENAGKPRLLQVRVNFEEPLPQALSNKLVDLPCMLWRNADDEPAVQQFLTQLTNPPPKLSPHRIPLEMDSGAVPLDAKFYVVRSVDKELQAAIARRDTIILLKGARQVGKTSLLARGIQGAREAGSQVILTDFQKFIPAQLESLESFFLAVGEILADRLDLDVYPQDNWKTTRAPHLNFERYFRREILAKAKTTILWAMDEADRLLTCPFRDQIFALFRSWHNERTLEPDGPCSKLIMVIAYATEAYLFIKDQNQSPFNVGTKLILTDFTPEQVADLNQRHGSPLQVGSELNHFYQLVGGQPYLVRRGFNDIVSHNRRFEEFVNQADHDEGAFGDHLRRILMSLRGDAELAKIVHEVLDGKPCSNYDAFYRLRSAGIFSGGSQHEARLRCKIYATYLKKHL